MEKTLEIPCKKCGTLTTRNVMRSMQVTLCFTCKREKARMYTARKRNLKVSKIKVTVKRKSISKLKKELDAIFSRYIRQKYADQNGYVTCYTCTHRDHWKKLQNGHLVSRYFLATRFDERNCRPQCITCNIWRNGMTPVFSERIDKELGEGTTATLYREAQKLTFDFPYESKIEEYKDKLRF